MEGIANHINESKRHMENITQLADIQMQCSGENLPTIVRSHRKLLRSDKVTYQTNLTCLFWPCALPSSLVRQVHWFEVHNLTMKSLFSDHVQNQTRRAHQGRRVPLSSPHYMPACRACAGSSNLTYLIFSLVYLFNDMIMWTTETRKYKGILFELFKQISFESFRRSLERQLMHHGNVKLIRAHWATPCLHIFASRQRVGWHQHVT